jgi:tetraacyldisaccharide 4'-kinase
VDDQRAARATDYYHRVVSGRARGAWPGILRTGLWLASIPYGQAVRCRNGAYDRLWKCSHSARVPVVSVGNLTVGGTGKTPCVEYIARFYRRCERRVAILSRGYGGAGGRNDEALVLEDNLLDVPHLQGADRVALAGIAVLELESEVLLLDDGFQHRRLRRDLDVVLLDATNPWGHGYLFPRGLLREPARSLGRAGMVLLTRCDQVDASTLGRLRQEVARLAPGVAVGETIHRPTGWINSERASMVLCDWSARPVAGFCGIGNPDAFRRTLADAGMQTAAFRVYPDHHAYTRADVAELQAWASQQAKDCVVVTTQKDLVKLCIAQLGGKPLWALRIGLHFWSGQETLDHKLNEVLRDERSR